MKVMQLRSLATAQSEWVRVVSESVGIVTNKINAVLSDGLMTEEENKDEIQASISNETEGRTIVGRT